MRRLAVLLFLVSSVFLARLAAAHHSFAAYFDSQKAVTLTGEVANVEWTNPHFHFSIDVKGADGAVARCAQQILRALVLLFEIQDGRIRGGHRDDSLQYAPVSASGLKKVGAADSEAHLTGGRHPSRGLEASCETLARTVAQVPVRGQYGRQRATTGRQPP